MRIKRGVNAAKKRRKIMKLSKGYFGAKSKLYRVARQEITLRMSLSTLLTVLISSAEKLKQYMKAL